jgi:hypothetical protein
MPKKKRVTRIDSERKLEVWKAVVIPLIVAVLGSLTVIGVAYLNQPKTEYKMSQDDQLEVNKLSAQINLLSEKYFEAKDQTEKERLDTELRVLAETEAAIMRKYNQNYLPRWPLAPRRSFIRQHPALLISLALMLLAGISTHYALKRIWEWKRRRQLLDCIAGVLRRDSRGVSIDEVIRRIRDDHPTYRPEEIIGTLRSLEAEHKVEMRNGGWALIVEDFF